MNDSSPSRPESTAGPTATAVADPPPPPTWGPPAATAPARRSLGERWRLAPRAVRWGALTVAALVLLLGVGLGSFALGRATAPENGRTDPTDVDPGGRFGDRPDLGGGPGAPGDQGVPPGLPDQGSVPDTGSDSGTTQSSWYVVPTTPGAVVA